MAAVYGIALRVSFVPDRWELLRGFQTAEVFERCNGRVLFGAKSLPAETLYKLP
jgi:hypothetical protein